MKHYRRTSLAQASTVQPLSVQVTPGYTIELQHQRYRLTGRKSTPVHQNAEPGAMRLPHRPSGTGDDDDRTRTTVRGGHLFICSDFVVLRKGRRPLPRPLRSRSTTTVTGRTYVRAGDGGETTRARALRPGPERAGNLPEPDGNRPGLTVNTNAAKAQAEATTIQHDLWTDFS